MEFKNFKTLLQNHFAEMSKDADQLFEVNVDKDALWNLYLDSFPAGTNKIYRERREYDCSCCRQFIRAMGNVVIIKNNQVYTLWNFQTGSTTFQPVVDALDAFVKAHAVTDLFVTKFSKIGTDKNYENINGTIRTWEHFYLELPAKFVNRTRRSEDTIKSEYRSSKQVFKRSLDEITMEAVDTVLELIAQKSLYKGDEWQTILQQFKRVKIEYETLPENERDNYAWVKSGKVGGAIARIRNHSIGTLLVNISESMDLDMAVRKYEAIVAPANYKRPKAIYTKRMLDEAKKTIEELGYMDSLARRHATLDDITVNNILFSNKDASKRISGASVFDDMEKTIAVDPKKFSKVQEISIEDFVSSVLPTATSIEALLENRHAANMVSLIAPKNMDSKTMFKWNNGFSWAYSGNMTDSNIRQNVKNAGGNVEGVLRFSIQWNDQTHNQCDYDAHCRTPNDHIYFGHTREHFGVGFLDVDIINPHVGVPAVENIAWADKSRMTPGTYEFWVNCYSARYGNDGFNAEIEFDGQIYSYNYPRQLRLNENVKVATVTLDRQGNFSIVSHLPATSSSHEVWGVNTNQFIPVTVICNSPNYWDEQNGIGHKHYFFMLKDCINPERPNGMYNEFLKQELAQHKRVFEALGSKMAVEDNPDQLSGLGFSSTKRNELTVKVKGATERILKIKF